jgi:hypothetical protein
MREMGGSAASRTGEGMCFFAMIKRFTRRDFLRFASAASTLGDQGRKQD